MASIFDILHLLKRYNVSTPTFSKVFLWAADVLCDN